MWLLDLILTKFKEFIGTNDSYSNKHKNIISSKIVRYMIKCLVWEILLLNKIEV